jgi:beta-N-acetylhexosaminidase
VKAGIVGIAGPALTGRERRMIRVCPPAGVILFRRNIVTPEQVSGLVRDLRGVLPPRAVLMVDQEGGRVARLGPPYWAPHPPCGAIGALWDADQARAVRAAWIQGALIGAQVAAAGFDVVCAPVLDRRLPGAHDVVGDRAFHADPVAVGRLGRAMASGLLAAGVQPVAKHVPGHGRATADSHHHLPRVDATDLDADLLPFLISADMPWAMTAHIAYAAFDADWPATLSASVIQGVIRGRLDFSGVLVSDDLTMKALSGTPAELARRALAAGCDLVLHCSGVEQQTAEVLAACPDLPAAGIARMRAAAVRAAAARRPLDVRALAVERDRLLAA